MEILEKEKSEAHRSPATGGKRHAPEEKEKSGTRTRPLVVGQREPHGQKNALQDESGPNELKPTGTPLGAQ